MLAPSCRVSHHVYRAITFTTIACAALPSIQCRPVRFKRCIRSVSSPFALYTAVHTGLLSAARKLLIYNDARRREKWLFACFIEGITQTVSGKLNLLGGNQNARHNVEAVHQVAESDGAGRRPGSGRVCSHRCTDCFGGDRDHENAGHRHQRCVHHHQRETHHRYELIPAKSTSVLGKPTRLFHRGETHRACKLTKVCSPRQTYSKIGRAHV